MTEQSRETTGQGNEPASARGGVGRPLRSARIVATLAPRGARAPSPGAGRTRGGAPGTWRTDRGRGHGARRDRSGEYRLTSHSTGPRTENAADAFAACHHGAVPHPFAWAAFGLAGMPK